LSSGIFFSIRQAAEPLKGRSAFLESRRLFDDNRDDDHDSTQKGASMTTPRHRGNLGAKTGAPGPLAAELVLH